MTENLEVDNLIVKESLKVEGKNTMLGGDEKIQQFNTTSDFYNEKHEQKNMDIILISENAEKKYTFDEYNKKTNVKKAIKDRTADNVNSKTTAGDLHKEVICNSVDLDQTVHNNFCRTRKVKETMKLSTADKSELERNSKEFKLINKSENVHCENFADTFSKTNTRKKINKIAICDESITSLSSKKRTVNSTIDKNTYNVKRGVINADINIESGMYKKVSFDAGNTGVEITRAKCQGELEKLVAGGNAFSFTKIEDEQVSFKQYKGRIFKLFIENDELKYKLVDEPEASLVKALIKQTNDRLTK